MNAASRAVFLLACSLPFGMSFSSALRRHALHPRGVDSVRAVSEYFDTVVIGAGVGGLSTAARLARAGQKVLVLEANAESVGAGRMGSFQLTGNRQATALDGSDGTGSSGPPADWYRFDSGPSLLLLPEVYEAAFDAGGGSALWRGDPSSDGGDLGGGGGLDVKLVAGPRYAIHFDDGARSPGPSPVASRWPGGSVAPLKVVAPPLRLWGGLGGFAQDCASFEALEAAAGARGGGAAYAQHMVSCQRLLDGGLPNFIAGEFRLSALVQMLGEVLSGSWPLDPQEKQLRKRFQSPQARAALSFQSLYVGLTPFDAPAVFGLLQPLELGPVPDPQRAERRPPQQGIYYPVGGFGTVADGLVALARGAGAEVRYDAKVQRLLLHGDHGWDSGSDGSSDGGSSSGGAGGSVGGVRVQGPATVPAPPRDEHNADGSSAKNVAAPADDGHYDVRCGAVVLNADVAAAEQRLLAPTHRAADARTFDAASLSCSVVALHLALNRTLGSALAHHSLFLAVDDGGGGGWDDAKARPLDEPRRRLAWAWGTRFPSGGEDALDAKLGGADAPGCVNFYVHAPSRTDPSACPNGHDAITVLVPCAPTPSPHVLARPGAAAAAAAREASIVAEVRAVVMERLSAACGFDVESHLVAEQVVPPSKWASAFGLRQGAVFGLAHPISQLSIFRPGPRHPKVPGLFLCGASARPGNGVPLVLLGSRQTAKAVLEGGRV